MTENINDIRAEEVVLFETRPNKVSEKHDDFNFLLILGSILSLACFGFLNVIFNINLIFSIVASIVLGIIFAVCLVKKNKQNFNDKVKITNKGIYYHEVGTNKLIKIPFSKIRNFSCQQGLMDKKVHCADIKINTDTNQYYINNINEYRDFCRIISENAHYLEPQIVCGEEIRKKVTLDEKILWEGKKEDYKTCLFFAILFLVLAIPVLFIIYYEFGLATMKSSLPALVVPLMLLCLVPSVKEIDKKTYYIVTNKRIIYTDKFTDSTCKVIPLETIEQCLYIFGTRHKPSHIQVITPENKYELHSIDDMNKVVSIIKSAIAYHKRTLKKQEDSV